MISSLANFLMLILYHGGYPERTAWTLLMFTMGAVATARIAIENSRSYAMGYLLVLGAVTFFAMWRLVGSPVFSLFILALIGYLADRIVHDCTLIDESIDASGQGLIDSGRLFMRNKLQEHQQAIAGANSKEPSVAKQGNRSRKKTHQPGRTVMFLALLAVPLFGLGQFLIPNDSATWNRSLWLLAIYLFASLSLLVTTSFLGLRRYLRQRDAEMPNNVSVAWIAGGLLLIALILGLSYFAPLPGQALVAFKVPEFLKPKTNFDSSSLGWGDEAADNNKKGSRGTDRDEGNGETKESGETKGTGEPKGSGGESGSGGEKGSEGEKGSGGERGSGGEKGSEGEKGSGGEKGSEGEKGGSEGENRSEGGKGSEGEKGSEGDEGSGGENGNEGEKEADEGKGANRNKGTDLLKPVSAALSMLGSLLRYFIMILLAAIVAVFLWLHRDAIAQWWHSLWNRSTEQPDAAASSRQAMAQSDPLRPFSSFRNPIGIEKDPRKIIIVTFQALEAWAREENVNRRKDETPNEFLKRIVVEYPQISAAALQVVDAYNRIVYGGAAAQQKDIGAAKDVWQTMSSRSASASRL